MRCTLQEMNKLVSVFDYHEYIDELWMVLQEVEALRYCEVELFNMKMSFAKQDGEKMEELAHEANHHRREIDEWFRTLRDEE